MPFDSLDYLVLLGVTFAAFHLLGGRWRVPLLIVASAVFYASWNAPFLVLVVVSAVTDFLAARRIKASAAPSRKKAWLALSLAVNLGLLGYFKYADFLRATLSELLPSVPVIAEPWNIVLPIGISFYTFQTMSYSIDVYRGRLEPTGRFLDFLLYVSFFPQLIAGPIERASHLLPQIGGCRDARPGREKIYTGLLLIVWGLFKKCALSDNLALVADRVYAAPGDFDGLSLLVATYAFAFQIFFDFSAYSNIARGSASLFGIKLVRNFRLPYLADGPADFWRRWHVSLSEWIRDYLYVPLGGSRRGTPRTLANLTLTMALAGLWHGAAWHFCIWGLYHGALLVIYRVLGPPLKRALAPVPAGLLAALRVALMFHLTCAGWVLFRATSLGDAAAVLTGVTTWLAGGLPAAASAGNAGLLLGFFAAVFALMVWQERADVFRRVTERPIGYGILIGACIVAMALLTPDVSTPFIYFQF